MHGIAIYAAYKNQLIAIQQEINEKQQTTPAQTVFGEDFFNSKAGATSSAAKSAGSNQQFPLRHIEPSVIRREIVLQNLETIHPQQLNAHF